MFALSGLEILPELDCCTYLWSIIIFHCISLVGKESLQMYPVAEGVIPSILPSRKSAK